MKIKGLEFVCTCEFSPEQYDIYDESRNVVGYVRLRYGNLYCRHPNVEGEIIYSASIGDEWTGQFESTEQRLSHLEAIADRVVKQMKGELV